MDEARFHRIGLYGGVLAALLHVLVHAPFQVVDAFGEQDAARIAVDVVAAIQRGHFAGTDYRMHSSPLYMLGLRALVEAGWLPTAEIPRAMALASALAGPVVAGALFVVFLDATASPTAAAVGVLAFEAMPIVWISSLYGFPTLLGLSGLALALLALGRALRTPSASRRALLLGAAVASFGLALGMKIDLIVSSAAFGLVLWSVDLDPRRRALALAVIGLVAGFCFLTLNRLAGALEPTPVETAFRWSQWDSRFPMQVSLLFDAGQRSLLRDTFGRFTYVPFAIAAGLAFVNRRGRIALFWALAAALPTIVFWGLRAGNSGRHNLAPALFLGLVLGLPLRERQGWLRPAFVALLIGTLALNALRSPVSPSTVYPSGALFPSALRFRAAVERLHTIGRRIASFDEPKLAVVGCGVDQPYYIWETWLRQPDLVVTEGARIWHFGGLDADGLRDFARRGYHLVICDPPTFTRACSLPELAGRFDSTEALARPLCRQPA
jgi:hypothetical protein